MRNVHYEYESSRPFSDERGSPDRFTACSDHTSGGHGLTNFPVHRVGDGLGALFVSAPESCGFSRGDRPTDFRQSEMPTWTTSHAGQNTSELFIVCEERQLTLEMPLQASSNQWEPLPARDHETTHPLRQTRRYPHLHYRGISHAGQGCSSHNIRQSLKLCEKTQHWGEYRYDR